MCAGHGQSSPVGPAEPRYRKHADQITTHEHDAQGQQELAGLMAGGGHFLEAGLERMGIAPV